MLDHDDAPLSDSAADLHVEESGWLPNVPQMAPRSDVDTANRVITFLLGVMAGGTAIGTATATNEATAIAVTGVMLVVWVVTFFVWLVWG